MVNISLTCNKTYRWKTSIILRLFTWHYFNCTAFHKEKNKIIFEINQIYPENTIQIQNSTLSRQTIEREIEPRMVG